jgi:hypothetical protein
LHYKSQKKITHLTRGLPQKKSRFNSGFNYRNLFGFTFSLTSD